MDYDIYFSGQELFGDDLSKDEIENWYIAEENGYYELVRSALSPERDYTYEYRALNEYYAYRHMSDRRFRRALALGCARGDDVAPIAAQVDEYLAIEPAERWWSPTIGGRPARFVKPSITGDIPCASGEIDLAICLGVLHHIPNVTHVINEIARVVRSGGLFVLREPISSMGDWSRPRIGLTKNERGLPLEWLDDRLTRAGFVVERRALCMFPLTGKLAKLFGVRAYEKPALVHLDRLICALTRWNYRYHRDTLLKKLAPASVFYVLKRS